MEPNNYTIDPATSKEIVKFQEIQAGLGWDPCSNSYTILGATSPDGLFLGKLDGKVISCIVALKYGSYGTISVYWVKSQYRGKGYGLKIFKRAMEFLKDMKVIMLDSVEDQVYNYAKWSFKSICRSFKRYQVQLPVTDNQRKCRIINNLKEIDVKAVILFDSTAVSADRQATVKRTLQIGLPFVAVDSNDPTRVLGYASVTKCSSGLAIAPLIAENESIAEDLIKEIFQVVLIRSLKKPYEALLIYTLDDDPTRNALMEKYFPRIMYECTRMCRVAEGHTASFVMSKVFGFSTYERP